MQLNIALERAGDPLFGATDGESPDRMASRYVTASSSAAWSNSQRRSPSRKLSLGSSGKSILVTFAYEQPV